MWMPESYFDVFTFVERMKTLNKELVSPPEHSDPRQRVNEGAAAVFFVSAA